MKYLVLLLLLLPSISMANICAAKWDQPKYREDGAPLLFEEIAKYDMYLDGKPYFWGIWFSKYRKATGWWQWGKCPDCIQMTTTDTDGRVSKKSKCVT